MMVLRCWRWCDHTTYDDAMLILMMMLMMRMLMPMPMRRCRCPRSAWWMSQSESQAKSDNFHNDVKDAVMLTADDT